MSETTPDLAADWTPAPGNDPLLLPDDVEILLVAAIRRHHCGSSDCTAAFEGIGLPTWWYRYTTAATPPPEREQAGLWREWVPPLVFTLIVWAAFVVLALMWTP